MRRFFPVRGKHHQAKSKPATLVKENSSEENCLNNRDPYLTRADSEVGEHLLCAPRCRYTPAVLKRRREQKRASFVPKALFILTGIHYTSLVFIIFTM